MMPSQRYSQGLTLLEVILVLLLSGLLVSAVVVNFSWDSRDDQLEKEAYRFQQLFHYAAETALMRQQEWGVQITPSGYQFLVYLPEEDIWQPADTPASLGWHDLAPHQQLKLELEGLPWQEDSLLGSLNWDSDRLEHMQTDDEEAAVLPHIFILSSGEITPFELVLQDESQRPYWYVQIRGEFSIPIQRSEVGSSLP
ncbi:MULTISPECIES: type II secretion system minor pseudopilin GspH [Alkalimonas]|uniref:Type II secretion system protein H n=1 Tax=Alkalimonas mucilaginosa TaxID=3057676 RepID=A0ABU7JI83_9GAMM|nr:type II secretion system minor pseudopilin GspH [Alkalimonas sp. MEB004]MEE2025412.1 type II secretion system minor pseudopilin GspH [Alkalimonas sp. MEB004]